MAGDGNGLDLGGWPDRPSKYSVGTGCDRPGMFGVRLRHSSEHLGLGTMSTMVEPTGGGISSPASEDLDTLRGERDALLNNDVERWLTRTLSEAATYSDFENSISYRITQPIRWGGIFVRKVRSDGLGEAVALGVSSVQRRIKQR